MYRNTKDEIISLRQALHFARYMGNLADFIITQSDEHDNAWRVKIIDTDEGEVIYDGFVEREIWAREQLLFNDAHHRGHYSNLWGYEFPTDTTDNVDDDDEGEDDEGGG